MLISNLFGNFYLPCFSFAGTVHCIFSILALSLGPKSKAKNFHAQNFHDYFCLFSHKKRIYVTLPIINSNLTVEC